MLFMKYQKWKISSLYENKIGNTWTPDKNAEGYTLNEEDYRNITKELSKHNIQNYLRTKMSRVIQEVNRGFLDNEES